MTCTYCNHSVSIRLNLKIDALMAIKVFDEQCANEIAQCGTAL